MAMVFNELCGVWACERVFVHAVDETLGTKNLNFSDKRLVIDMKSNAQGQFMSITEVGVVGTVYSATLPCAVLTC